MPFDEDLVPFDGWGGATGAILLLVPFDGWGGATGAILLLVPFDGWGGATGACATLRRSEGHGFAVLRLFSDVFLTDYSMSYRSRRYSECTDL